MRRNACLLGIVLAGVFVPGVAAGADSGGPIVFSSFLPEYPLPDNFGVDRTFVVQRPGASLELAPGGTISPDGSMVAGVRAGSELWISRADGSDARQVVAAQAGIGAVAWSNASSRVAYVSDHAVWVVGSDGSAPRRIFAARASASLAGAATWAPDDAHLLVFDGSDLWLVASDGSARTQIFAPATSPAWAGEGIADIAWAPRTDSIALTIGTAARCGPGTYENCFDWYVETFDRAGTRLGGVPSALDAAWSPDGKRLAYATGLFLLEPDQVRVETAAADLSGARSATWRVRKRAKGDCWQSPHWLDASTVIVEETQGCQYDAADPDVGFVVVRNGHPVWRSDGRAETVEPGGRRIAFLARAHGRSTLFVADLGRVPPRVTEIAGSAGPPTWSADGRSLAFTVVGVRGRDLDVLGPTGRRRVMRVPADRTLDPVWYASRLFYSSRLPLSVQPLLWAVRPDGSGLHRLPGASGAVDPSWSPDGSRIAFAFPAAIATTGANGGSATRIVPGTQAWYMNPSWSPDGRHIVYTRTSYGVYTVDSDGGASRLVVKGADSIHTSSQAWSPDGRSIAYVNLGDIDVIDADGTGARTLLSCGCGAPAWSPDGSKLAFYCYSCAGGAAVAVADADGTGMRVLVASSTGDVGGYPDLEAPAWSPDGAALVFSGTACTPDARSADLRTVLPAICVIAADGTGLRALTPAGVGAYAPSWRAAPP